MALNFRLFNCDRTFSLDKVEALIQRVAKKLSRETKIEKTYFPLPRMNELCRELEEEGSHFEYAVFVVHAHESRLSINEKNAGIGYAKVYRALQKVTGDRVLIVIGGDDNYKGQEERDTSVLSRWAWLKICSQFTEDYVNGVKSFIFSWEENHHPVHEEALEFYLDPTKRGTKFVPRPKPPPAKVPAKEETKNIDQAQLLGLIKKEQQSMESKKFLEKEYPLDDPLGGPKKHDPKSKEIDTFEKQFPPEHNKNRKLPKLSGPGCQESNLPTQPFQQHSSQLYSSIPIEPAQAKKMNDLLVTSFYAKKESVSEVEKLITKACKELKMFDSGPRNPYWNPHDIPQQILRNKPRYLVLVSDFAEFKDLFSSHDNHGKIYHDILKNSKDVGTKLIFAISEDIHYREGDLHSLNVNEIFIAQNQRIPSVGQPTVVSWNKTPWDIHREALAQFLSPHGVGAAPQQYGATKQDPTSRVPYTQPEVKRHFYKASIRYGRVVEVLVSDPPGWQPSDLNYMLKKNDSKEKAIIESSYGGDGRPRCIVLSNDETRLYKIAGGVATDKMHSILVYSYHVDKETNDTVSNFIHHLDVPVLLPYQPIEPDSLKSDIISIKPDYVMLTADADVLKDEDEFKKLIREHETGIKDIDNIVGQGAIIMLFGDKSYKEGELASKKVTKDVGKLTKGIVESGRLTVMTCRDKPYIAHQNGMKKLLRSKNISFGECRDPEKGLLKYKADIKFGQVDKVLHSFPRDWQPEEPILKDVLKKNGNKEQATLEFWEDKKGDINPIVTTSPKGYLPSFSITRSFPSLPQSLSFNLPFSSSSKNKKDSGKSHYV